ncbi:MAG: urease accessory protein UreD [Hyphomicrobiales bacterium]|nr:urease accessory protein UreD [Hyphomicrobiales bacterium]
MSATFARTGKLTLPQRLFETGGLRWRFPRANGPCEAAIVNVGGGVAGGDVYRLDLTLTREAEVEATTVAAEKVYRSDGSVARIEIRLALESRARLLWLPQETILFDGARLERRLLIDLDQESSLLVVERLSFGRLAMGETRIDARLHDSWRVLRGGQLVFADEMRLLAAGADLDRPAVGDGARALATILAAAPAVEARLPDLRAALGPSSHAVEAGASFFDGLLVARLLSPSPARLRAATIAAIVALGGREPPRLWR